MKLYMKQKVFSWKDKFNIMDAAGQDKYYVEGKAISIGKKLTIYDAASNEVAFVKQKVVSLLQKFTVEINGEQVAEIKKKFTLLKPKYFVEGPGWEVTGNFLAHDYEVKENGNTIIAIRKQWMSWGDSFEIDIADESQEVLAIAVVLAIDTAVDNSGKEINFGD